MFSLLLSWVESVIRTEHSLQNGKCFKFLYILGLTRIIISTLSSEKYTFADSYNIQSTIMFVK